MRPSASMGLVNFILPEHNKRQRKEQAMHLTLSRHCTYDEVHCQPESPGLNIGNTMFTAVLHVDSHHCRCRCGGAGWGWG